jgi:hypothetical protein
MLRKKVLPSFPALEKLFALEDKINAFLQNV